MKLQNAPSGAFCNTFDLHKPPFSIKTFVLAIFEWLLKASFTVDIYFTFKSWPTSTSGAHMTIYTVAINT